MVSIITSLNQSVQNVLMKTIGKQNPRKAILSIFAVAVFLLGGNTGHSQTAPTFTVCPGFPGLVLPAGDGGLTLNTSNIPSLLGVTAVDPDGAETITYSASPSTITCADIGPGFSIAVTATDSDGADVCNITVDIFDGGPFASCADITVELDAAGMYTLDAADEMALSTGSSACTGIADVTVSQSVFDCSDVGAPIQVTVIVEDGLTATAFCLANITVVDNENPTFTTCPADPAAVANAAGMCNAPVTVAMAVADDNCAGVMITNDFNGGGADASGTYPVGTTTVTFTATDASGNTNAAVCSVDVVVNDTETPVAMCNAITVELDATGNYTLTAANLTALSSGSTDNCTLTTSSSQSAFDCTDVGANTVTITVSDGTNSDDCSIDITVEDNINPTLGTCPMNITQDNDAGMCSAVVTFTPPTFDDNCGGAGQAGVLTAGMASGSAFPVGTTTVTYTFTDAGGNMVACSFDVTVNDTEAPMVTNPGNMAVNNAAGNCEATVAWPTLTGSDNCPGTVTVTYTATDPKGNSLTILTAGGNDFADFPVGESTVNYSVSDAAMPANTTTGSFLVNVVDNEAPVVTCPAAATLDFASCNTALAKVPDYRGNVSISDNCTGYTVTQTPMPGMLLSAVGGITPADGETFTVTITVTDGFANNLSDNCSFVVTLNQDDQPVPSITGGVLPSANSECGPLTITAPTATDGCGNLICGEPFPAGIATNLGPACGAPVGPCTPASFNNNTRTALPDNTPGGINSTINVSGFGTPDLLDDVNISLEVTHTWVGDIKVSITSPSGTTVSLMDRPGVPAGTFGCASDNLNVTFDDDLGGSTVEGICDPSFTGFNNPGPPYAISGTFNSEFITLSNFVGENPNGDWILNISDNAGGDLGFLEEWTLDICVNAVSSVITDYEFPVGTHNITWIYDDGAGNTTNQLQTITVSDDVVDPVVSCQDITVELDGNGDASIVADDLQAPVGFTIEMQEDVDNAGNAGRVNLSVTATTNTTFTFDWDYSTVDPGFEALTYYVNGGPLPNGTIITASTATGTTSVPLNMGDVFTLELLTIDNTPAIGLGFPPFPPGDISTVTISNFSPGFTGDYSLGNWNLFEDGVFSNATVLDGEPSDNCTDVMALLPTLAITQSDFDCSDIGTPVSVTLSVEDEAGNIGSCTATVTVIDALGPVLTQMPGTGSVADITVECDNIPAMTQVFTANDNCDGVLSVTPAETDDQSNNSASCTFYNYTITRSWSSTDANSNSTTITQEITVEDNTAPTSPTFSDNIPVSGIISTDAVGCTASVSLAVTSYVDCAAFSDLTITNNSAFANAGGADASGDYPIGMYNINFTAIDPCGNTSNWTESFEVVDLVAPVASCVNDLNLGLPASGVLTLSPNAVDNNSFDECSAVTLTVSPNTFTCADVGIPRMVTLTATDAAGNSSSCTTTVNLQDNNAPTAICQSISLSLSSDGTVSITAADIDNGSFDDCTPVSLSVSPSTFDDSDLGNNTVTLMVMDENGNSSNCNANVFIALPETCFEMPTNLSGGAGDIIEVPVTAQNFTALVGFQFEVGLQTTDVGEFIGVSNVHPDLANVLLSQPIVTDSFISMIDTTFVPDVNGMDSIASIDTTYTDLFDNISVTWTQNSANGMGNLIPVTIGSTDVLFTFDLMLTGDIGDFSFITLNAMSSTTPPQVIYSFSNNFYPTPACVTPPGGLVQIGQIVFAGEVYTEDFTPVALTDVDLNRLTVPVPTLVDTDQTEVDGLFEVNTNASGNYQLNPTKDIFWANGIDIVDVGLIQRHTVGNPYVGSAYKKIAADVSGDGDITTFDAVLLNSFLANLVIPGDTVILPTPSWQFVDAKQMIANDPNAFVPPFNNFIEFLGITSDSMGNDFIAVKTGDIGGLSTADVTRADDVLKFSVKDQRITEGQELSLDFTAENFEQMMAYQWVLNFDPAVVRYKGYSNTNLPNLGDLSFNDPMANEGRLVLTWFAAADITKTLEDVIFSLDFEVLKSNARISDLFSIEVFENFDAVAYRGDETPMDIELVFDQSEMKPSAFTLNQNTPNPFKDETLISFNLPETTDATLTIMDVTGRVLKQYEGTFTQGYNELSINRSELPHSGTLFYELKTPDHTASMKMIIID